MSYPDCCVVGYRANTVLLVGEVLWSTSDGFVAAPSNRGEPGSSEKKNRLRHEFSGQWDSLNELPRLPFKIMFTWLFRFYFICDTWGWNILGLFIFFPANQRRPFLAGILLVRLGVMYFPLRHWNFNYSWLSQHLTGGKKWKETGTNHSRQTTWNSSMKVIYKSRLSRSLQRWYNKATLLYHRFLLLYHYYAEIVML